MCLPELCNLIPFNITILVFTLIYMLILVSKHKMERKKFSFLSQNRFLVRHWTKVKSGHSSSRMLKFWVEKAGSFNTHRKLGAANPLAVFAQDLSDPLSMWRLLIEIKCKHLVIDILFDAEFWCNSFSGTSFGESETKTFKCSFCWYLWTPT